MKKFLVSATLIICSNLGSGLVKNPQLLSVKKSDIECLARNVYHEARNQPIAGQIAVAQVTVNRVRSGEFQSSICSAVYAYSQFSWTLKPYVVNDRKAWEASVAIATAVLTNSSSLPDFKALYYHTKQVRPKWAKTKKLVAVIGDHIFYS
jgi:spore germination cell wall hydrolase CwlJ-like protein